MSAAMRSITLLGATGSIGASTLDVVSRHPDRYRIFALSARNSIEPLFEQCRKFRPRIAVLSGVAEDRSLRRRFADLAGCDLRFGAPALEEVASHPDCDSVMAAIVGAAGLAAAIAAARSGKRVLLANKEALVMAGAVFMSAVRESGALLLPVDSEHNAVFQCMAQQGSPRGSSSVRRVLLTASGGPFRTAPLERLDRVTPDEACAHPNWTMGRKISVDSATMMNKGLEVIEARWLFNAQPHQIEVLIHPESIVHSLVEYSDGSVIAQLGNPDMRTPIAHALGFPERIAAGVDFLDLARVGALHFTAPDSARFPCLRLAYEALQAGGAAPAILNAANEVAVARFLSGEIGYMDIPQLLQAVLELCEGGPVENLDDVLAADRAARACAERCLAQRSWHASSAKALGPLANVNHSSEACS